MTEEETVQAVLENFAKEAAGTALVEVESPGEYRFQIRGVEGAPHFSAETRIGALGKALAGAKQMGLIRGQ